MNKKLFFSMFAATGMLLTTSCSNDELNAVQSEEKVQVTFSLGVEDGIGSRAAISDGTNINQLVYGVFDSEGNPLNVLEVNREYKSQKVDEVKDITTTPHSISITLAKGQSYKVAFWAQNSECTAYNTDSLKNVTVNYENAPNNDDNRDAFFKTVPFEVNGNKTIDVVLQRPFAQINVGVTQEDWEAAIRSGINVMESSVVISKAATKINLLDGTVSEPIDVTYNLAKIPAQYDTPEDLEVDVDGDGTLEKYKWLSMSYILVDDANETDKDNDGTLGDAGATLEGLKYTFKPGQGKNQIEFSKGLAGAPVQRNWRTNIVGRILTGDVNFNITVDNKFENSNIYPNKSEQELQFAATFGGSVTLTEDVELTSPLKVSSNLTINLNGHTISNADGYAIENYAELTISGDGAFEGLGGIRSHGGKLTINGGSYTAASDWNAGTYDHILKAVNTEVVINGGTFDATIGGTTNAMINVSENSVVTINGGTFKNVNGVIPQFAPYMFTYEKNGKLIINGGEFYGGWRFNGETTTTDIYGGNFTVSYDGQSFHATATHVLTIYGGSFSLENGGKLNPTNYLAAGHTVIEKDGLFVVATTANDAETLATAIANGGFVALAEDIATTEAIKIPAGTTATIDLNGKTITVAAADAFVAEAGATLTISGNGEVVSHAAPIRAIGGKVVVEGGKFTQTGDYYSTPSTLRYSVDSREGGEIIVKGGTFNTINGMINVSANSSVVIEGGIFNNTIQGAATRHFAYIAGTLTIKDGEFTSVANAGAGGTFFCGAGTNGKVVVEGGKFSSLWNNGNKNNIWESYYGGSIEIKGGIFNHNGGIKAQVIDNTDAATKDAYPYMAK